MKQDDFSGLCYLLGLHNLLLAKKLVVQAPSEVSGSRMACCSEKWRSCIHLSGITSTSEEKCSFQIWFCNKNNRKYYLLKWSYKIIFTTSFHIFFFHGSERQEPDAKPERTLFHLQHLALWQAIREASKLHLCLSHGKAAGRLLYLPECNFPLIHL